MVSDTNDTQQQLIASFKNLMLDYPFKKITIKMITEQAGVIRPTFYNHFRDKYEIFEVILDQELINSLYDLINIDMIEEATKMIFAYIEKNRKFYQKAFEVTGQNSFEEILTNKIKYLMAHGIEQRETQTIEAASILTKEQLVQYFSTNLVMVIKMWLQSNQSSDVTADEIFEAYTFLVTHDFQDFFED
jgi:probable dihydroxyacetone kinase regulator